MSAERERVSRFRGGASRLGTSLPDRDDHVHTHSGRNGYEQIGALKVHELGPVVVTRSGTTDTVTAVLKDRLDSTVATIDTAVNRRSYDPFGAVRNGDYATRPNGTLNLAGTIHGFTGHTHADDVALIHMNGRVYDPNLGRFLSVDPIVQFPASTQSLNPYSYLMNNPFSGTDPSGFVCVEKMTGSNICGVDTGAQNGRSSETKTVTDAQTGQKTTYTRTIAANGTQVFVQVGSSGNGARAGFGTKPTGQSDGSKSGTSGVDEVERDPGQQGLQRAAEFGKGFGKAGEEVLNAVNPGDPVNLAGGMLVGKVLRAGKGVIERGLDELTQKLLGEKAAREGLETVVARFWTRNEVNGTRVYQRSDLIDASLVDGRGRTNLQRMQSGLAPIGPDGDSINLHHMLQTQNSPIAEMTRTFHETYSRILHINPNTIPSGINRGSWNQQRESYWMKRAKDFEP